MESTIPLLPCRQLDDIVPFYEALGFEVTYRRQRPNPYLCVKRDGIDLHFFGVDEFRPEDSMGSVIILTSDSGSLYNAFASGLREVYGRIPTTGLPRITRPRRKQGTAAGFTVVDPGGNWLRVSVATGSEDDVDDAVDEASGNPFERVLLNAARQGDAHGDEVTAIGVLDSALIRHADASPAHRVPVLAYLAELLVRIGDHARARQVLLELGELELSAGDRKRMANELAVAAQLDDDLRDVTAP